MSTLVWGIKASLIAYIRSLPDGTVEVSGGASTVDGEFRFEASPTSGRCFVGTVTLTAHNGMLHLVFTDPALVTDNDGFLLTIADPDDPSVRLPFAHVASLTATAHGDVAQGTVLTEEGADLFFGPYEAGMPLDDPALHS